MYPHSCDLLWEDVEQINKCAICEYIVNLAVRSDGVQTHAAGQPHELSVWEGAGGLLISTSSIKATGLFLS